MDGKVEKLYPILKLSWHHETYSPFLNHLYAMSTISFACSTDTRTLDEHKFATI